MNLALICYNFVMSEFLKGESFAKKDVMLMERRGMNSNNELYAGLSECEEICYKNPVLKDQQWSAYIDRSPGAASCSEMHKEKTKQWHVKAQWVSISALNRYADIATRVPTLAWEGTFVCRSSSYSYHTILAQKGYHSEHPFHISSLKAFDYGVLPNLRDKPTTKSGEDSMFVGVDCFSRIDPCYNGNGATNLFFQKWRALMVYQGRFISSSNRWANGMANRTLRNLLKVVVENNLKAWKGCISFVEFAYNKNILSTTDHSTFELECFHACVAGCGYKFDVPSQKVDQIHPSRPPPPPPKEKLTTPAVKRILPRKSSQTIDDIPGTSA
ncbi:hypothetical protein MTR67_042522 [Solanum verrucosum]|uniref:Uncharacterized protein n=1 Tax=Solanum verrucosum TaxID=315347 RepID=A0AAF0UMZ3_SOLVR|nr:hypothetical protein MTR67_042522 [Solanum verrucosum]